MTVYVQPGQEGSKVQFKDRYENWIGGRMGGSYYRPVHRERLPGERKAIHRGGPRRRCGRRARARCRPQGRTVVGQGLGHRARRRAEQDRRPHRCEPGDARRRRILGQRQADPRNPQRGHPARGGPLPLLRLPPSAPRKAGCPSSTTTPRPTTSTSRSASWARSSRGTSPSSWPSGRWLRPWPPATRSSSSPRPTPRPPSWSWPNSSRTCCPPAC